MLDPLRPNQTQTYTTCMSSAMGFYRNIYPNIFSTDQSNRQFLITLYTLAKNHQVFTALIFILLLTLATSNVVWDSKKAYDNWKTAKLVGCQNRQHNNNPMTSTIVGASSAAQQFASGQFIDDTHQPNHYKTYLSLNASNKLFWYHGVCNILSCNYKGPSWEPDNGGRYEHLLLSAIIGPTALIHIRKDASWKSNIGLLAIQVLQVERQCSVFVVDPELCQRVARLWWPLLSEGIVSDNVTREVVQHSTRQFGIISPLQTMTSWKTWVVLEVKSWETLEARLYPSDKDFLDAVAFRCDIEGKMSRVPEPIAALDDRYADISRRRWEPILEQHLRTAENT
ncbi:hypothetical protein F4804DRAFT_326210 [Jackrogersella minutella]|nr:hypothetical protein F4804DRAFT_326210 [Jackrogersella minutella]